MMAQGRRAIPIEIADLVVKGYVEDGLTMTALAEKYGIAMKTAAKFLDAAGVKRDLKRRLPRPQIERLCTRCQDAPVHDGGKCKPCLAAYTREHHILHKYGITAAEYDAMLEAQGGGCAICQVKPDEESKERPFHVDHDHSCCPGSKACRRCVRGILCPKCNWGIASLGEQNIAPAMEYLTNPPGVPGVEREDLGA